MGEHREHGFAEGQEDREHTDEEIAEEEHKGRFSEGQEEAPESAEKEHRGRFSEGEEEQPETPDKTAERRFSEGQEESTPE